MLIIKAATEDGNLITLYLENDWKFTKIKEQIKIHLNIPVEKQKLYRDGNLMSDDYDTISDSGLKNGDVLLVKTDLGQYDFSSYLPPEPDFVSDEFIMDKAIEYLENYKPGSMNLEALKAYDPELVKSIETEDINEIFNYLKNSYLKAHQENIEHNKKLLKAYMDPLNPESQELIHKEIDKRRKDQNLMAAQNYLPESFGRIEMLYVKAEMNDVSFNALVDTGAQYTIMSKGIAQRCNVLNLVDERYSSVAVGVGITKTLGKIHMADLKIGSVFLPVSITVLDGDNIEFILGLDVLRRYTCDINLKNNYLGINDVKVPFLSEAEVNKTKFTSSSQNNTNKPKETSTSTTSSSVSKNSGSKGHLGNTSSVVPSTTVPTSQQPVVPVPPEHVIEEKVKRLCETFNLEPSHARHLLEIAGWDEEFAASFITE